VQADLAAVWVDMKSPTQAVLYLQAAVAIAAAVAHPKLEKFRQRLAEVEQ